MKQLKQVFISENSINMFNSMYVQQTQQLSVMSTQSVQSFSDIFIFRSEESIQSITLSSIEIILKFQLNVQQNSQVIQRIIFVNVSITTASTKAEKHTRFLSMIINKNKIFQISCFIKKTDETKIHLEKSYVQANQESDMNVISTDLIRQLDLNMHFLSKIEFQDLTMHTADHREMLLKHWIWLNVDVKDVWRSIQCFVTSELVILSRKSDYLSLILDISWLWSVNAIIAMRDSKILIENSLQEEKIHEVTDLKLVFCKKHNLLMYFKSVLAADKARAVRDQHRASHMSVM